MTVALITGITGMVGSHMADFLLKETDWEVHGLIRWRSPLDNIAHLAEEINSGNRIKLIYGDLLDDQSINTAVQESKPDYVFHLAAQSFPKTSFSAPIHTFDVNILGTYRLLEALRAGAPNSRIHICSSSEVFGRVPPELVPIKEETPFHPASPYAISKVGTDLIARFFGEAYSMQIVTTRMFTHTGPRRGDVFAESSFAKQIAMIENGQLPPLVRVGNLESMRTFADVRDAVRAYFLALTNDDAIGKTFNIGGTHSCTIGEMLEHLISLSPVKEIQIQIEQSRLRPIDADLQIPDTTFFRSVTGWAPTITFEETMMDLLNYWRERVVTSPVIQR
jgi:GDPmannose 4,6-dehydratase